MARNLIDGQKAGSKSQRQPVIAPDSASSITKLKMTVGLSEGEIEGFGRADIKLDGTPLTSLSDDIICDYRFGTNDQEYINGVDEVANEIGVGVELTGSADWVKLISNPDIDHLGIRLRWGPLQTSHTNGDVSGVSITYEIYIAPVGGSYERVLATTLSDKTSDSYERYHEFKLPVSDNGWMVKVVRVTPSSQSSFISDKMYVQAYSEIIKSKFTYPYTSLVYLEYDAKMFSNVAKVAVNAKGLIIRVPSNYDPVTRQYSGLWSGTFKMAYSNNPAWVYYDLVTNPRYGCGDRIDQSMVDKWSLYRLAQYCDQMVDDGYGGLEPRFTCNVYLQSKERAYDILNRLTGLFRAINFWNGAQIVVDADIPQDTSYLYTNANVVDGLFEYAGTAATDLYSAAKVAWDNPANGYNTEYEVVSYEHLIKKLGFKVLELDAWGCTSRGQALRAGRWALLAESDTVTFKVGMDGYLAMPGKIIEIQDEFYAGKSNGGRVISISESRLEITLDRPVETIAGDTISFNTATGQVKKYNIVSSAGSVVTLSEAVDSSVERMHIWAISSSQLATQKYRILTVKYDGVGEFTISAVEYNPKKYEDIDSNILFDEPPTSIINPIAQDAVKNVIIDSYEFVYQGLNTVNLNIKWERAVNAVEYLVEIKKDDGSWLKLPATGNNSIEVENIFAGTYIARVTAISAYELKSLPTYSVKTVIQGKLTAPQPPLNPRIVPILFGIEFYWDFPTNSADIAVSRIAISYEDPTHLDDETSFVTYDKAYSDNKLILQHLDVGTRVWFKVKLIDKLGFESPYTNWVSGVPSQDVDKVLDLISGHISEGTLDQALAGKIDGIGALAGEAHTLADEAKITAANAQTAATNAQTAATNAQTTAVNAQTSANDASVIASNAKNTADNASTAAVKVASDLITSTNQLNEKIANEISARITAISDLSDGLTTETAQRKSEDTALLSNIETYKASTNGTLASLQSQITTNATNVGANATQINALDARLTTNESKTNTATAAAATAQQTANTAVSKADAASTSINALKSTLRVQADSLNIDPHFVSGLEYYAIAETPTGNSVTAGAYGENGSLGIRVVKSNADPSPGTNTNVNTNRTDGFFLKANNTYRATVRCKLVSGTGSVLGRFHRKSDNAILTAATLSVTSTSSYVDLIYTYKPTVDVVAYFGTWLMAAGTIDYDSISIVNATAAVASDANASAISNLASRVTNAEGTLTSQGNSITQLNNSILNINGTLASKADASALSSLTDRVTVAEGSISSQSGAITNLQNSVSTINSELIKKVDSSAFTALSARVASNEESITSQGSSLTNLQNSLSNVGVNLVALADQLKTVSMAATSGESYITWSLTDSALKPDTFYTLSFWAVRTPNVKSVKAFLIASSGAHHKSTYVTVGTTNLVRYSVTFKTNADAVGVTYSLRFDLNGSNDGNNATLTVQKPQLEEGQVATYWKPSTKDKADASALSMLQNTVTQQGKDLTSNSNAITSLQNNVNVINGTLANKADASALSALDSKVVTIDGKVTSNTASLTSLNNAVTNGSSNLIYNTLYNDLANIVAAGNHSIAVDSATYARSKVLKVTATGAGQDGVHQILMTATVASVPSSTEPLVLSFYAKADTALSVKIQLFGGIGAQIIALTPTWTKYTITSLRKAAAHVDTTSLYMSLLAAGVAYFTNVQLERGTIATSYSAASTETGNLIAANASALSSLSSTVTQQGNTLTSQGNSLTSLNNSLVTTNNNVATAQKTANDAVSAADAAQKTANTKADASALEALSNTVTSQGGTLTSQGNSITSLTNTLNNLSVGSTNLLSGTDLSTHPSKDGTFKNGNMISATATTAGSVDMLAIKSTVELLAGEYVVSFWAKAETAGTQFNVYFYNPNTTTSGTASNGATTTRADGLVGFALTTTMTKYFVKYKQAGNTSKKDVLFRIQPPASGTNKVWLALPKLEEGTVVTDWSPALTDIATSAALSSLGSTVTQQGDTLISHGNSITSLNNSVNTINGTLTTKADSSAVNSLAARVSATEGNINSQSNSITSLNNAIKGVMATAGELIPNPTFVPDYNQMGMTVVSTTDPEVPVGCAYQYAARLAVRDHIPSINNIACKEGDVFEISALVACATGTAGLTLYVGKASTPTGGIGGIAGGASTAASSSWARITWKWTVPANCNYFRPYISVGQSSPFGTVWFITDWHCKNITAAATAQSKADANATALATLQNTVTQQGGTLTSQGNQITALNNSITSINGALSAKADSSALATLDSRVTATENGLATTNSSITTLQAAIQSQGDAINLDPNFREGLKFITAGELATGNSVVAGNYGEDGGTGLRVTKANDAGTSNTNTLVKTPTTGVWLKAGRSYRATVRARKVSGTAGLLLRWIKVSNSGVLAVSQVTATDTVNFVDYSLDYTPTVDTFAWFGVWVYPNACVVDYSSIRLTDRTSSVENATTASAVSLLTTRMANAEGTLTSQGSSITQLNNSILNINGTLANKADASAFNLLDSKVSAIDGRVTASAESLTTLTSTVNDHTSSISNQATSIDGIKNIVTLTVDNNGVVSGWGLVSEIINGQVKSTFGVNADTFYIGAPANNKKPFVVLTSPGVINGVTVPAGTYIDTAFIGAATIGTAHINDLAVTTAKIGDGQITTAKIGDLQVDTLKIKDNAVTVPNGIYTADMQKWEFVVYNHPVGTLAGTRTVQEFNVQTNGGKLRIDATFNYATGLQVGQISANLDVKKAVTLVAQLVVNGTVVYEQEVYPTTLGKNGLSIEYIGAMATPVYLHPASTGIVNIKLNVSARAKFSNTSFGTHAPYDYYMTAASASIATMELKK